MAGDQVRLEQPLKDEDYRAIAAFRAALRRFLHFSETAAKEAGLTPQQHQLLLAVRGHAGEEPPTVGNLAEVLQIWSHSTVGLVNRLEALGYVRREGSTVERRRVYVRLTEQGEDVLRTLTTAHRAEIRRLEDVIKAVTAIADDAASVSTSQHMSPPPGADGPG